MSEYVTRTITREEATALGIDDVSSMPRQKLCVQCNKEVEWIDCPTGGWWAHWEHPSDNHDAVVELDEFPFHEKAMLVRTEHIQSFRHQEEWSMIFSDPEYGCYWETSYYEPSGGIEDVDRWNNADEITLAMVQRIRVTRFDWISVRRPASAG